MRLTHSTGQRLRGLFWVAWVAMLLLIGAASGPVAERRTQEVWSSGIDIALVVDISESMEATDYLPNRMEIAKQVLKDFVGRRTHDRIGLVLFGGEAVTKSPLTHDLTFLKNQIDDIRFRELKQGTAIGMGLLGGISRLRHSKTQTKIIILMTDGDSNVGTINPITAANLARQENIKIYTIGIGQKDRVLVPIYAYDATGRKGQLIAQVPSYLNPELLKKIAFLTGGRSFMARDGGMLARIVGEIDRLEKSPIKLSSKTRRDPLFQYPLLFAVCLLAAVAVLLETRFRAGYAI